MQSAVGVGKGHFQQTGDETAGGNIMTGQYPAFVDELLNGAEGIGEIFGVNDRRHIIAHMTETLGKGGTAEALFAEREVDVVK